MKSLLRPPSFWASTTAFEGPGAHFVDFSYGRIGYAHKTVDDFVRALCVRGDP